MAAHPAASDWQFGLLNFNPFQFVLSAMFASLVRSLPLVKLPIPWNGSFFPASHLLCSHAPRRALSKRCCGNPMNLGTDTRVARSLHELHMKPPSVGVSEYVNCVHLSFRKSVPRLRASTEAVQPFCGGGDHPHWVFEGGRRSKSGPVFIPPPLFFPLLYIYI